MGEKEVRVSVRPAKKTDIDPVLNLTGSLVSREDLSYLNEDPSSLGFVAEAEGHIIGFSLAHILYVGMPLTRVCVIQGIVVQHEYRRHGIGEELVKAIFQRCSEREVSTIRALVEESDARLRLFVEQLGFQRSTVANYDKILYF
jgi:N-acetylglutamate synthase-like GNAT family acetyltransferase